MIFSFRIWAGWILVLILFRAQAGYAQSLAITLHPSKPVIATKQTQDGEEIRRTPGSATVIDRSFRAQQRGSTIKDLTDFIPSVYAQPRNGAESSRLSIRGSGLANVFQGRGLLVLQDGVPINMADGEFEFPVIDPWLIDYATILPGANALEEGGSTLGGAINFVTPTGVTGLGTVFQGEGGSFGTLHGLVSSGKAFENSDIFAAVSGFHQTGFRDNNEQSNTRFNGNAGWLTGNTLQNHIYVSHTTSNAEIPGAISRAMISDDPSQANLNNIAGHFERNLDITRLAYRAEYRDGPNRIENTFYYAYRTLDNPVTTYILEHNNDFGSRLKFTHEFGLNKWIAGLNLAYGAQDETRYRNVGGQKGNFILSRDLYALTSEAYGQYEQYLINNLYGIASFQASYDTRDIEQNAPAQAKQTKEYAGYNPRIGVRYDFNADTQLFANISRSFEPPSWGELSGGNDPGFNNLDAQTSTTEEMGGRGQVRNINWSATFYRSVLNNELINYRFSDGSTDTINADNSLHKGLELGLNGDVFHPSLNGDDAVSMRIAYTLSRFHLDDDPLYGDNQLPGMPEHYVRGEVLYRNEISNISIGPNIEWVPTSYPIDLTNSVHAESYVIYGARLAWQSRDKNREAYLEGRNLLDRHYTATTNVVPDAAGMDGRYFYPGEGRAAYAGLRWKF